MELVRFGKLSPSFSKITTPIESSSYRDLPLLRKFCLFRQSVKRYSLPRYSNGYCHEPFKLPSKHSLTPAIVLRVSKGFSSLSLPFITTQQSASLPQMSDAIHHDSSTPDQILDELKASAEVGDLLRLKAALARWDDAAIEMGSVSPNMAGVVQTQHETSKRIIALQGVLYRAAYCGHTEVVAYLRDSTGCSITTGAARAALFRSHWDVLQCFLERGWDINCPV